MVKRKHSSAPVFLGPLSSQSRVIVRREETAGGRVAPEMAWRLRNEGVAGPKSFSGVGLPAGRRDRRGVPWTT